MKRLATILAVLVLVIFTSCNNNDDNTVTITTTGNTLFNLASVSDDTVSGTINFSKISDTETLIEVQLTGDLVGNHPVAIYNDNAVDGTSIALNLNSVDAAGYSSTTVTALDNGLAITYENFLVFDGHVKVLTSDSDSTLLARGDIGVNKLTGMSRTYALQSNTDPTISGLIIFAERENDETLVVIQLNGTTSGDHPANIYTNNLVTTGTVAVTLNNVIGTSGESRTNISALDDSTAVTYTDMINYNGHTLVHLSNTDTSIIAEGNIGSN